MTACQKGDMEQAHELFGVKDLPYLAAMEKAIDNSQRNIVAYAIQSGLVEHLGSTTLPTGR